MSDLKICRDCKHSYTVLNTFCNRNLDKTPDIVTGRVGSLGEIAYSSRSWLSGLFGGCGVKGKFFEQKVETIDRENPPKTE